MAVTCVIDEFNTAGETESTNVANLNMGSDDSSELTPATYPITAATNGFEKWFKWAFTGVDNKVDNLQTWISTGALHAEADMKTNSRTASYGGAESYVTPTQTTSTVATEDYAEADPAAPNMGIGGSLSGNLATDGDSDYQIAQYQTTGSHPAGDITQLTITFQWDEQ